MMQNFTHKRRFLAAALALTITASLCFGSLVNADNRFTDVPESHWAHDAIEYVVDAGLFAGTSDTTFNPEGTMTRAMLWVVLARMDDVDTSRTNGGAWYQAGLDWAVENGVSDGTNPNNNITREQFAAMLYRYAENANEDITADTAELNKFIDTINISSYALQPLAWAVENGIVSGTSSDTISPSGNATRAQVATMLMRYDRAFNDENQSDNPGGSTNQPEEPEADYTISLAIQYSSLEVGKSSQAIVTVVPYSSINDLTFTYKSSDSSVATVRETAGNGNAVVTAVGPGTATITVTDSNGLTSSATVTVTGESSSETPSTPSDDEYADIKDEIIELTNEVRAEHGVAALTKSDLIMEIAQQRAEESAEMLAINHQRPDGTSMGTIFTEYGFDRYTMEFDENLAQLSRLSPERAVTVWKESAGHLLTMTSSNKTFIGIGIAQGSDGKYYCSMILTDRE